MKNLKERTSAMRESRGKDTGADRLAGRPLRTGPHRLYCPQFSLSDEVCVCLAADCAHYNPDTDECVHVEAAQAQVWAGKMLEAIAEWLCKIAEKREAQR